MATTRKAAQRTAATAKNLAGRIASGNGPSLRARKKTVGPASGTVKRRGK